MPILERDPWRMQYFEDANKHCPADLIIPTEDGDAFRLYPKHRWIYNKMEICATQGIKFGPHGLEPEAYPVFSKPIYNMRGMGAESRLLRSESEYQRYQMPGHMWMEVMDGDHVSTDVAVVDGEPVWWRHTIGEALDGGMFDYWTILASPRPEIESYCADWLRANMGGYTGMVNFETIGARIIEAHMRFADQWPDLYGANWLDALVKLYTDKSWYYQDNDRRDGYSVVLFGGHGIQYSHPEPGLAEEILAAPEISSVQITFFDDKPLAAHSMPPGGFRLAIVNTWDLEAGRAAREKLALNFWSTQTLVTPKRRRRHFHG